MVAFLESPTFNPALDWIERTLLHSGTYAPMLLLVLEEMGLPLPIPGDMVVAYTGYQISRGNIPYIAAFLTLLVSVLLGSSILYYFSSKYGQHFVLKFGKYLHLNENKLLLVEHQFKKYGPWLIIFGRHLPWFRVPITVFAGMSEITYKAFISCTFISVIFWIPLYLYLGQRLGRRTMALFHAHPWYSLLTSLVSLLIISTVIYIVVKSKEKQFASQKKFAEES